MLGVKFGPTKALGFITNGLAADQVGALIATKDMTRYLGTLRR
jgi:hypothetical protein